MMEKIKWYQKSEMIVAFSALFISVLTAVVGIYSAYTDRTYARASVWPSLEIARSYGDQYYEYSVRNVGTGPALIKFAKIKYKGKIIHYWRDIPGIENFTQSHIGHKILPAQEKIKPITYKGKNVGSYLKVHKELSLELCYCSIYDECWINNGNNQIEVVKECRINDIDRFLQ